MKWKLPVGSAKLSPAFTVIKLISKYLERMDL